MNEVNAKPVYSRENPSPRLIELREMYKTMHVHGDQHHGLPPEGTFSGGSLEPQCLRIAGLCRKYQARSILDYGSGKGNFYQKTSIKLTNGEKFKNIEELWAVDSITCYDPGYEPFSQLPTKKFDGVISTDVWEHCPEDDLPWIINEIFSYAEKFVYANVACYPALKVMPNGENPHCTIKPTDWWVELLRRVAIAHPDIRYHVILEFREPVPGGDFILHEALIEG
jgi:hypothetical protein